MADGHTRREFLLTTTASIGITAIGGPLASDADAQTQTTQQPSAAPRKQSGLLLPQRTATRDLIDLSGFWQFQLDPKEEGEANRWFDRLPAPRTIAVPCSWNELFD